MRRLTRMREKKEEGGRVIKKNRRRLTKGERERKGRRGKRNKNE